MARGVGRPAKDEEEKQQARVIGYVTPDFKEEIKRVSKETNMKESQIVFEALQLWMENRKNKSEPAAPVEPTPGIMTVFVQVVKTNKNVDTYRVFCPYTVQPAGYDLWQLTNRCVELCKERYDQEQIVGAYPYLMSEEALVKNGMLKPPYTLITLEL